jgi:hypothetical protein
VPWSSDPGTEKKPRLSWGEYIASHATIPLEGPIRYTYGQLREKGASALDATTLIKGLIITGMGATGIHAGEDYSSQAQPLHQAVRRQRAVAALRSR